MSKHPWIPKSLPAIAVAAALLPGWASADYHETRNLTLDAANLHELKIWAGAGRLEVRGVDDLDRVTVRAEIEVRRIDESDGPDYVARAVKLDLAARGPQARLVADSDSALLRRDWPTLIHLVVRMPARMPLDVDDDSGPIDIAHLRAGLRVDDDSGKLTVRDIHGGLDISDDSGSMSVEDIEGRVTINDDSGGITLRSVRGDVEIDDDSGGITVTNIIGNVHITDDSGSMRVEGVDGHVTVTDDSGNIEVKDISGDLEVLDDGSGSVRINDIRGKVRVDS